MARFGRQTTPRDAPRVVATASSAANTTHLVEVLGVRHPIRAHGTNEERIATIANHQRGRAARWQLRAAGISDDAVDRRTAKRFLIRKRRGVYAVGHDAPAPLGAETEALLACGPHAVLSHHTAARLLGLIPDTETSIHVTIRARHGAHPHRRSSPPHHPPQPLRGPDRRRPAGHRPATDAARSRGSRRASRARARRRGGDHAEAHL